MAFGSAGGVVDGGERGGKGQGGGRGGSGPETELRATAPLGRGRGEGNGGAAWPRRVGAGDGAPGDGAVREGGGEGSEGGK